MADVRGRKQQDSWKRALSQRKQEARSLNKQLVENSLEGILEDGEVINPNDLQNIQKGVAEVMEGSGLGVSNISLDSLEKDNVKEGGNISDSTDRADDLRSQGRKMVDRRRVDKKRTPDGVQSDSFPSTQPSRSTPSSPRMNGGSVSSSETSQQNSTSEEDSGVSSDGFVPSVGGAKGSVKESSDSKDGSSENEEGSKEDGEKKEGEKEEDQKKDEPTENSEDQTESTENDSGSGDKGDSSSEAPVNDEQQKKSAEDSEDRGESSGKSQGSPESSFARQLAVAKQRAKDSQVYKTASSAYDSARSTASKARDLAGAPSRQLAAARKKSREAIKNSRIGQGYQAMQDRAQRVRDAAQYVADTPGRVVDSAKQAVKDTAVKTMKKVPGAERALKAKQAIDKKVKSVTKKLQAARKVAQVIVNPVEAAKQRLLTWIIDGIVSLTTGMDLSAMVSIRLIFGNFLKKKHFPLLQKVKLVPLSIWELILLGAKLLLWVLIGAIVAGLVMLLLLVTALPYLLIGYGILGIYEILEGIIAS